MVHNGIEYGDMQMICEAYHLMRELLDMPANEIGETFLLWNNGELDSFLMDISADALQQRDPSNEGFLVDYVLDTAGQKGTGKWTSVNALDMGIPAPTVATVGAGMPISNALTDVHFPVPFWPAVSST